MNVSLVSDTVTLIELSSQEVESFKLSFSQEDYSSPALRRALWEILTEAEKLAGKSIYISQDLSIDFMPDKRGGCLMIVTENEEAPTQTDTLQLYSTEDFEKLLAFIFAVRKADYSHSALYQCGGDYRLFLEGAPAEAIASEFDMTALSRDIEVEGTLEGYACLIEENALEILCGFFLKK